jgi:hypothetical protein
MAQAAGLAQSGTWGVFRMPAAVDGYDAKLVRACETRGRTQRLTAAVQDGNLAHEAVMVVLDSLARLMHDARDKLTRVVAPTTPDTPVSPVQRPRPRSIPSDVGAAAAAAAGPCLEPTEILERVVSLLVWLLQRRLSVHTVRCGSCSPPSPSFRGCVSHSGAGSAMLHTLSWLVRRYRSVVFDANTAFAGQITRAIVHMCAFRCEEYVARSLGCWCWMLAERPRLCVCVASDKWPLLSCTFC